MAGAFQASVRSKEYALLRSIFFKQGLPQDIYLNPSAVILVSRRLERLGYIKFSAGDYQVTKLGVSRLHELGKSHKIDMIDPLREMLLDESPAVMQYRVTGSLARQIAERVSNGE